MAEAKKADEPSMEEILASIRRIISDEDAQGDAGSEENEPEQSDTPVEEAVEEMGDAAEMSQDDLDKLFDVEPSGGGGGDSASEDEADDMAAAMEADAAEDEGDDDVLELTEELAVPDDMEMVEGLAEDFDSPGGDLSFAEASEAPPAPAPIPPSSMDTSPVPDDLPDVAADAFLTSDNTGDAVHAAFDNLSNMFVGSQAQTVEELVKEMLRPMLKAWLDQNLPGMVEQMVQKEIQRVTRRR